MQLAFFIEVLAGGLLAGVMYSLVALGFVLIYPAIVLTLTGIRTLRRYPTPAG